MACTNDESLGPAVHGCRGDFDFTQTFQRLFFSVVPAAAFIVVALARISRLARRPVLVSRQGRRFQLFKSCTIAIYAAVHLVLLIYAVTSKAAVPHVLSVASLALVLAASIIMLLVSFFEHARSARSSTILNVYLAFTLLLDIVQLRTLWLSGTTARESTLARIFTASVALKAVILLQEAQSKVKWALWDESEHSPEEHSSIYSLSVFYWLRRLFAMGYSKILKQSDLYSLDQTMSTRLAAAKLEEPLQSQVRRSGSHSLRIPLIKAFPVQFIAPVFPQLCLVGFRYSQSFFMQAMIEYLENEETRPKNHGYGLIGACGSIYIGMAVSNSLYSYYAERASTIVRAGLCALIYKKTTQVTVATASEATSMTLMSSDVLAVCTAVRTMHLLWSTVLQVALGCWLLYTKLGVAFLTPVVIICICSGLLSWIMAYARRRQTAWMERIQQRVALTAAAIADMKFFKMLGMSDYIADMIQEKRRQELVAGNAFRAILVACFTLAFGPTALSPALAFAVTSQPLSTAALFVSLSFINILAEPAAILFQAMPAYLAGLASLRRIENYLAEATRQDDRTVYLARQAESDADSDIGTQPCNLHHPSSTVFKIADGSFGWENEKMVLKDINASFPRAKLTCIIGPVASGKSSLCNVLLGEIPVSRGVIETSVSKDGVGYCAQTPFLCDGTIRDNIVGNCGFRPAHYNAILDATMLSRDIEIMENGDNTKIGSNGVVLSGGQKQRVSLARALYAEKDVMILDDILSGLDANTETEVFNRVLGRQGIIRSKNATAILCTHSVRHLGSADHIIVLGQDGRIVEQGSFDFLSRDGTFVSSLAIRSHDSASESSSMEENGVEHVAGPATTAGDRVDASRHVRDRAVYMHYLRSLNHVSLALFFALTATSCFCTNFSPIWISYWSADAFHKSKSFYVGIYALIRVVEIVTITIAAAIGLIVIVSSSGLAFHKEAINTVARAPLSALTATDTGTITNLFSQDMTLIDGKLPIAFLNTIINSLTLLGYFFVVAVASPYVALGYIPLVALLYGIQSFYLRTSRQLRLLDLEMKTPLYNHYLDTIRGLTTIRAFGNEEYEIRRSEALIDGSQRPAYLLAMIQEWLLALLTLVVGGIGVILTALATQLGTSASFTGASLLALMNLASSLTHLMDHYTTLETSLGAVNRIKTFSTAVQGEGVADVTAAVPETWPSEGCLTLNKVSASYGPIDNDNGCSSPSLALKDISMSILPRQRVAICGRTGSGKSSFILLLLRLLNPTPSSEQLEVDGISLLSIDRSTIRQRFILVPQDAVFLPGKTSIRLNLDPTSQATDDECFSALEAVHLSTFVEENGGLDGLMRAEDLSAGQQQLFGLGRAVLRRCVRERNGGFRGGVLLLDEMNSKLDRETDSLAQDIIRREFADYTVIMVAHRLNMVMNLCDQVYLLDKGEIVEHGRPRELADAMDTRFGELWRQNS